MKYKYTDSPYKDIPEDLLDEYDYQIEKLESDVN